ncbi:MAG: glycosyltransferase [Proteobacteria bacterium]|nr:MAG: glycosyltransferase [Pseudomonadota bacterium]
MRLSVVVPALDEAGTLDDALRRLARRSDVVEVLVIDASRDREAAAFYTRCGSPAPELVERGWRFVGALAPGRARQMNLGAALASGDMFLFLHADTCLPDEDLRNLLGPAHRAQGWGRFDVRLDTNRWWAAAIATAMNLRSATTGICTGDQGLFVSRVAWQTHGGFEDIPLMEDIEFSRRMKRLRPPLRVRRPVTTSARRWLRHGVCRTILLMWTLRLLYGLGVAPDRLARMYRDAR